MARVRACVPVDDGVEEFRPIMVEKEVYLNCQIKIYRRFDDMYIYSTPYGRSRAEYHTIAEAVCKARDVISNAIIKGELPYAAPKKKKVKISYPDYISGRRYDGRVGERQ